MGVVVLLKSPTKQALKMRERALRLAIRAQETIVALADHADWMTEEEYDTLNEAARAFLRLRTQFSLTPEPAALRRARR